MRTSAWVLGYHGCDRAAGEAVLAGVTSLQPSTNAWEWLGTGIYFWKNSASRAPDWADSVRSHPRRRGSQVVQPFVIGAVIDLGNCLDLLDAASIGVVKAAYMDLEVAFGASQLAMPSNGGSAPDFGIRRLDCTVIDYVHETRVRDRQLPFDSVRAVFMGGEPLYPGAGFHAHIQLSVRNDARIVGYCRLRENEIRSASGKAVPDLNVVQKGRQDRD